MNIKSRQPSEQLQDEKSEKLYKRHVKGALVRSGTSMAMWTVALIAFLAGAIKSHYLIGISISVLYLVLINPPTLVGLKHITSRRSYEYFSLFINQLEILGYTSIIYFCGGIEASFLALLYAALIAYVGVVAPRKHSFIVASLCVVTYSLMVGLVYLGYIPQIKLIPGDSLTPSTQLWILSVVTGLLYVVAYISATTANMLKMHKDKLYKQNVELVRSNDRLGREIDERKQAEEALRKSEERFSGFARASGYGFAMGELTGQLVFGNSAILRIVKEEREADFIAKTFFQYYSEEDKKFLRTDILPIVMAKGQWKGELPLLTAKGNLTQTEQNIFLISDRHGTPRMVGNIITDITERKLAEEMLQESEARLQQSQKMESIGTLAGGIAHDFNNVLYSIIGYTELTMEDVPEGSLAQSNLKEVFKSTMRAKDMVQQILTFSRKARTEKKPIKLQPIVKEALKLLRTSIPTTIEIHQNIDANCGPVLADSTQVHQVVMNLATNAYQAMREKGGLLELTLVEEQIGSGDSDLDLDPGTYLKLTVRDTGHGMDNVVMGKIFDPYFSTKGPGEGTGMGLAVVHGIVKDHGGNIKVYSEPGESTVFHIYLPLIETRPAERKTISEEPVLTGTERILLVDDEESIVFMTQQILERLGYQVTPRTSSVEALEAFKAKPNEFDLVITDLTMPNMTGVELAPKILEIKPDIPIIICTGFSEIVDEDRAKAVGICEYVMKPISKDQLARTIRKVLDEGKEE